MTTPRKEVLSDTVTLWLGDCRDVLPMIGRVDAVVTSPPYNTMPGIKQATGKNGMHTGNAWILSGATGYKDDMPEEEYQLWLNEIILACADRCDGLVWMNHKVRYRDGTAIHPVRMISLPLYCEIIWDRGGSMALNCKRFAPSHEGLWAFGTPNYWDDSNNTMMSVWRIASARRESGNDHPCPYPNELICPVIQSSVASEGCVMDPFMGSGTTGVACVNLGRKFIGIEREPKYFDIARRRITEALSRPRLPFDEPVKPKQESLL